MINSDRACCSFAHKHHPLFIYMIEIHVGMRGNHMICPDCGGVKFELFPIKGPCEGDGELERTVDFYIVCCQCGRKLSSQEIFAPRRKRRQQAEKSS